MKKHLIILSVFFLFNGCTNLTVSKQPNHTTTHQSYDLFGTQSQEPTKNDQIKEKTLFKLNPLSSDSNLQQLDDWITEHCIKLSTNWQHCLNSLLVVKKSNKQTLKSIASFENKNTSQFYQAIYYHNQAELLLNKYNDRKHKIKASHLFIAARNLLEQDIDLHFTEFRKFLIQQIDLQLNNMVSEDGFLTVLISKPVLEESKNHSIEYAILNWSANALALNYKPLNNIRENNLLISDNACLINLEQAIKLQLKLNAKWATINLTKRNNHLKLAKNECKDFQFRSYMFDQVFLIWPEINWDIYEKDLISKNTHHPVLIQKIIFNNPSLSNNTNITEYIDNNPLDELMHYHNAQLNNSITLDDPCFTFNPNHIGCFELLIDNNPVKQLNDRNFLIDQLAYAFPYELLIQQLRLRLEILKDDLNIELDDSIVIEALFKELFIKELTNSDFNVYELKLLYAHYAMLNLSSDFLSDKDIQKITDFFFTQKGYQLKWELSGKVQSILGLIQAKYYTQK